MTMAPALDPTLVPRFQIGEWLVEPSLNRISRRGRVVKVEPKVMELLVLLSGRPGDAFSKEEITERLWPGTFVTESSIFRHVSELRRALEDDPKSPRYVETIPKRGYRLIPALSSPENRGKRSARAGLVTAVVGLVLLVGAVAFHGTMGSKPTIGVLSFRTASGEEGNRFAEALSALVRRKLENLDGLDVVRGEEQAEATLSGTVRIEGKTIFVDAALLDSTTGEPIWKESFRGPVTDVLGLQSRITSSVASAVDARLSPRDLRRIGEPRPQVDPEAYALYLKGGLFENRVDCDSFDRARESYSEAVHRDPRLVDAYPRLLDALIASAVLGCRPSAPLFSEVGEVLDLAEGNGVDRRRVEQAWAALAFWKDRDLESALSGFRQTTDEEDLSYAVALVASGSPDEGVQEARRCLSALPIDLGENWALGGVLYLAGRYDEAIDQLLQTLDLYPDYRPAMELLALSYWMAGEKERALVFARRSEPAHDARLQRFDAVPGYLYALAGDRKRAREVLDLWLSRARTEWVPKTSIALLHLALGEEDQALLWLRKAEVENDPWVALVPADPAFHALSGRRAGLFLRLP